MTFLIENTLGADDHLAMFVSMIDRADKVMAARQALPTISVRLEKPESRPMEALIDSGSEGSIISDDLARQCGLEVRHARQASTTSFSGGKIGMVGMATVKLYLGNVWINQRLYVAPADKISVPFILGMPFIRSARVTFDHSGPGGQMLMRANFASVRIVTPVAGPAEWELPAAHVDFQVPGTVKVHSVQFDDIEESLDEDEAAAPVDNATALKIMNLVLENSISQYKAALLAKHEEFESLRRQAADDAKFRDKCRQGINDFELTKDDIRSFGSCTHTLRTNTLYKRKGVKVLPRDDIPSDGSTPEGDPHWKAKRWSEIERKLDWNSPFSQWITPKFSDIGKGTRIHGQRLEDLEGQVKETLTEKEKEIFLAILHNREAALAWEFSECGRLDPIVAPPQVLKVVPHSAWQAGTIPIPPGLKKKATDLLKTRLERGILEESHALYRNPWFLVAKKNGDLRLINSATKMNAHTIRDALIPPSADEFSEDFAMCKILSLLDFFSGYDQVPLDEKSRDLTTFATPIGLLRMCTLPQGATNSVAQFTRVITRILFDLIPDVCRPFLDDITVRGPSETYDQMEAAPGVRRYVLEHLVNLDKVLLNVELAGCTIAGGKSQFCRSQAVIVGYLCGTHGRKPDTAKVIKINEWISCKDVTEVRSFVGITGFYRQWVAYFAIIARPLYDLLKKDAAWQWAMEEQKAMDELKACITTAPILICLYLGDGAGDIILMVDASLEGWGAVLMQIFEGKRHPVRFESGVWTAAERGYDATKRECRGILYAFRRLRGYLYGIHFILETDAKVLVSQLQGSANDIPGSLIMRWLSYLRLFDFEVRHVPGEKNTVADGLSRKPSGPSDRLDEQGEGDIEDFVDLHLNTTRFEPLTGPHSDESARIARYLQTFERPEGLNAAQFRAFRTKARKYFVKGGKLWLLPTRYRRGPALVVDDTLTQQAIIRSCHKSQGHRGREVTFRWLRDRYWWGTLWNDVSEALTSCPRCQGWDPRKEREKAMPTEPMRPMEKVHFDSQYLPKDGGKRYLMEARCDATGWVEAMAVAKCDARHMEKFARTIIYRFGVIVVAVIDGGPEMKGKFPVILRDLGSRVVQVSKYNPRANGVVEAGHWSLISAMAKMSEEGHRWFKYLDAALLADRTAIRSSHGYSAFYLLYGWQPILPMEIEFPTWRLINWSDASTPLKLFRARLRVLMRKEEDVEKARSKVLAFRKRIAERTDKSNVHTLRTEPLQEGDIVLTYDNVRSNDMSRMAKMKMRWQGPFRILRRSATTKAYTLETLDGIRIPGTYAADQVKRFRQDASGWWTSDSDGILLRGREDDNLDTDCDTTARIGERGESRGEVDEGPSDRMVNEEEVLSGSSSDAVSDSSGEDTDPRGGERILRPRKGPLVREEGREQSFEVVLPGLSRKERDEYRAL